LTQPDLQNGTVTLHKDHFSEKHATHLHSSYLVAALEFGLEESSRAAGKYLKGSAGR